MARFPRTEADIVTLAQAMVIGLTGAEDSPNVNYPSPPVAPTELTVLISAYTTAKNAAMSSFGIRNGRPDYSPGYRLCL